MKCPFLQEDRVRFCEISPVRKIIPRASIHEVDQRCSSADYVNCPVAEGHLEGRAQQKQCPFLRESLVQHCTAEEQTKFVPSTDSRQSRCNSDAHRYCHSYLQRAKPTRGPGSADAAGGGVDPFESGDIPVPGQLLFARNHMWLDEGADGSCNVGVDAFLARVLGEVQQVSFVSGTGSQRPSVSLTVGGVNLSLTFPVRINISGTNAFLRCHPEALTADPYGRGWLFEGTDPDANSGNGDTRAADELLDAESARPWMLAETERMTRVVHDLHAGNVCSKENLMADGGVFCHNLAQHLDREELLHIFNLFFAPFGD